MQHIIIQSQSLHLPHLSRRRALVGGNHVCRWRPLAVRAEPEDRPDSSFESLFSKELHRRGLSSVDEEPNPGPADGPSSGTKGAAAGSTSGSGGGAGAAPGTNPFATSSSSSSAGGAATRTRSRAPPPPMASSMESDQRQRSMDMVNEGLEGLFPRAKLLLTLGGSVFLGFLPFMLVFSLLFTGIYNVFGDSFLHGGRQMTGPPSYIDPERLLSEPTVDPYIPYNSNPYSSPDLN